MAADRLSAKLYGTRSCHLCVAAAEILRQAGAAAVPVDIAGDERLLDKYGMRIPVLQRCDNAAELDWPFDVAAVVRFLA